MDRKQMFEIELECKRLLVAFGRYRDDGDGDAVVEVLSEDSVWEREGSVFTGPAEIAAAVRARPPNIVLRHIFTNMKIDVIDEDHAEGRAYYTIYGNRGDSSQSGGLPRPFKGPSRVGDCLNRFVRTPDGWRISYSATKRVFSND